MLNALKLEPNEETLLELIQNNTIPSYRQAYSDRTSWLRASTILLDSLTARFRSEVRSDFCTRTRPYWPISSFGMRFLK